MFPPDVLKGVAVYHLATTGGQSQAYSAGGTVSAAVLPMSDRRHAMLGGDLLDPRDVYFEPPTDVRVGDKLVIEGVNYYVQKVFDASYFGTLCHKLAAVARDAHA